MSPAAPIPPSPRAACAGSRRALGHGQPRDGISDWLHAASARRLPWDELLPLLQGTGLCPLGVTEQVQALLAPWGGRRCWWCWWCWQPHPRALGGAVGIDWGLCSTRSRCVQWRNECLCLAWLLRGEWLSSPSCPAMPILSPCLMLAPSSSTLVLFGSNGESLLATLLFQPRPPVWMGVGGPGVWDSSGCG